MQNNSGQQEPRGLKWNLRKLTKNQRNFISFMSKHPQKLPFFFHCLVPININTGSAPSHAFHRWASLNRLLPTLPSTNSLSRWVFSLDFLVDILFGDAKFQCLLLLLLFDDQDCSGKDVELGIYRGKVLLVVNVASKWYFSIDTLICVSWFVVCDLWFGISIDTLFLGNSGFTDKNYTQLTTLYNKYKDNGLASLFFSLVFVIWEWFLSLEWL